MKGTKALKRVRAGRSHLQPRGSRWMSTPRREGQASSSACTADAWSGVEIQLARIGAVSQGQGVSVRPKGIGKFEARAFARASCEIFEPGWGSSEIFEPC